MYYLVYAEYVHKFHNPRALSMHSLDDDALGKRQLGQNFRKCDDNIFYFPCGFVHIHAHQLAHTCSDSAHDSYPPVRSYIVAADCTGWLAGWLPGV